MKTITSNSLSRLLRDESHLTVLDVRSPSEFASGHVPGAVNIPLDELAARVDDLPPHGEIVLACQSGKRAEMAAERLAATGRSLSVLEGGCDAWRSAQKPLIRSTATTWSLDRQVRLGAGLLVLTGVILGTLVAPGWYALAGFVGAGLTFAGLTNVCGMMAALRLMPWNKTPVCPAPSVREAGR